MTQEDTRIDEEPKDFLEDGFFYKILLLFQRLANWSLGQVLLGSGLLTTLLMIFWLVVAGDLAVALVAGLIFMLYLFADGWLLRALPKHQISFGPWQPQLAALALLRFAFAVVVSLAVLLFGAGWSLTIMGLGFLLGSLLLFYATVVEPLNLALTHLDIRTRLLPEESPPIRILHISDIHLERSTRREEVLLQFVDQTRPDLILISGDYLNLSFRQDPEAHEQVRQLLRQISAPYGVFAILGSPLVDLRDVVPPLFDDLPLRLLVNEWEQIDLGIGRGLTVIGLDCSHHLPTDSRWLAELVKASPNDFPSVLLYHSPDLLPEASQHGIDLYLCGHTHGGQVRIPGYGAILTSSQFGKRYEMGHYRAGRTHMYVSRGVGLEGLSAPRVRFLAPPEITLITIQGNNI